MATIERLRSFAGPGEREVLTALVNALPPPVEILTNLSFMEKDRTFEVDVIVVSAWGIAVIEVKAWSGDIVFAKKHVYRGNISLHDPRPATAHKAKIIQALLKHRNPVPGLTIAVNPCVIFANDNVRIIGELDSDVIMLPLSKGVEAIVAGTFGHDRQSRQLNETEVRSIATALVSAVASPLVRYRLHWNGHPCPFTAEAIRSIATDFRAELHRFVSWYHFGLVTGPVDTADKSTRELVVGIILTIIPKYTDAKLEIESLVLELGNALGASSIELRLPDGDSDGSAKRLLS